MSTQAFELAKAKYAALGIDTDAAIAKIVVDAKSEAEKIREQVQNLE